jgi:arsenate reductase (thioredoxin)
MRMHQIIKVLFVCIHNSSRSQMAETFLNTLGGNIFSAESAGLEPGQLNPLVVKSMSETGIDISGNKTKSVLDFLNKGKQFDYVITVCDETSGERCPVFPGNSKRLHWTFEDPSSFTGTEEEQLFKIGKVRDAIRLKIEEFIKSK